MSKLIITAAITGAVHIPTMSDYLHVTPGQIIEDAVKAYEAGAAIAHIHVRDPQNGKPTADPNIFRQVLSGIKASAAHAVCNGRNGGVDASLCEAPRPAL